MRRAVFVTLLVIAPSSAASPAAAQTDRIPRVTLKAPDYAMRKPAGITLARTSLHWNDAAAKQEEDEGGWERIAPLRSAHQHYEQGWGSYELDEPKEARPLLKWISKHAPDHLSADAARTTLDKIR